METVKKYPDFDLNRVHDNMNVSWRSIENCPISKEELEKIYYDYQASMPHMERIRIQILNSLQEGVTGNVHSFRSRVKDPDHLIAKIIRGTYRNPTKYLQISVDNYKKVLTDLIGVRIIILDKRDWRGVHNDLLRIYQNIPERYINRQTDIITNYDKYEKEVMAEETTPHCAYHAERPVAYIASADDRKLYKDEFLRLDNSKAHYRSVHYIVRFKDVYFEIQMRSLFEEGWLEFDHRLKYPNDQHNKRKQEYISILSNLANAADQLISYCQEEDFAAYSEDSHLKDGYTPFMDGVPDEANLEEKIKYLF